MSKLGVLKASIIASVSAAALSVPAAAQNFAIPPGDLNSALSAYSAATGVQLIVSADAVRGVRSKGVSGDLSADVALTRILIGTGFVARHNGDAAVIVPERKKISETSEPVTRIAEAAPAHAAAAVETVVVTSSKIKGDIQTVPIAITTLSQEQLTSRQIAGGPDLVKEVPNLTFSKTNFTGYNIQIRGIGTQAISVTTDPAVAVALNDIPFIRNHFFEQEFYDVGQVEVLRGPQGTLYGRNATAGVVNVITAKPTDQFEAMLSADGGNYNNRRFEGMINIPIVDDRLDIRVAGEWTRRDGYTFNELTNSPIDGRDLWSSRLSISFLPVEDLHATLIWEHFQENDDRLRSSKQLCKTAPTPSEVGGAAVGRTGGWDGNATGSLPLGDFLSQGCEMTSLYSPEAFEVPNAFALPYFLALSYLGFNTANINPYLSTGQSRNLRSIQSALNPSYKAKNDIVELNADYTFLPQLTLTAQTGFNHDFLFSTEDYNRFNTSPGVFQQDLDPRFARDGDFRRATIVNADGVFCDPQLGCADRLVAEDLSDEHAWQISQEVRLTSKFDGPLNFSVGANLLHYETEENYYVFSNAFTLTAATPGNTYAFGVWNPGVDDNRECFRSLSGIGGFPGGGFTYPDPNSSNQGVLNCGYLDPNAIGSLNNEGHNYFLSQNPYTLNSYAGFSEIYYDVSTALKLTGGLRWTDDQKHFVEIPSELFTRGYGYPSTGVLNQAWNQWTGRFAVNWSPKFDFTDQTLFYASYAHGYKAGGANPPGAVLLTFENGDIGHPVHPLAFKPEFINAYELGSKNTLLDGALVLDGDIFFYDYKGYQISEIVDRTSINLNFNSTVKGAELEANWEPFPGLRLNFAGGYESTRLANGSEAVDLMDRADSAHHPGWMVVKPFITQASNCIFPLYVVEAMLNPGAQDVSVQDACGSAYADGIDPITNLPYTENPLLGRNQGGTIGPLNVPGYPGFDPLSVDPAAPANVNDGLGLPPNNGAGFNKDLSGNELPNAPHFTTSLSAEYTVPVSSDWAATLHGDVYWQSQSFARVFNDKPYDKLRGYSNVNLALILTSADGWQVLGYLKNAFNATTITGDFLNSDDTGLTTNVFLTDPRLYGVRLTKNF